MIIIAKKSFDFVSIVLSAAYKTWGKTSRDNFVSIFQTPSHHKILCKLNIQKSELLPV